MSEYTQRLADAQANLAALKEEVTYLKLQIKQEAQQAKWAKTSPAVKGLIKFFPEADVANGAGVTYITVRLAVTDPRLVPAGWDLRDTHAESDALGAPVHKFYRTANAPINLYVIKQVR